MIVRPLPGAICRGLTTIALIAVAGAPALEAQAGLSSGITRVALTARVAPRASLDQLGPTTETGGYGTRKEVSVKVRLSANTGYRLVVVGTAPAASAPLWVRDAGGEFRELIPGSAVTVTRAFRAAGEWVGEVRYRTRAFKAGESKNGLPVRYEIRVDPTI